VEKGAVPGEWVRLGEDPVTAEVIVDEDRRPPAAINTVATGRLVRTQAKNKPRGGRSTSRAREG